MPTKIAALLTCHNRREKTLACLRQLYQQDLPPNVTIDTLVVDDGSTDGTSEAVRREFPFITLIVKDGSCYWNGGMRVAFSEALSRGYDYYLWLNDDTLLYPDAVGDLLRTHRDLERRGLESIIVGSVFDAATGKHTYGGAIRSSRWHPLKYSPVKPGLMPEPCEVMNGNCVLIPHSVANIVGNLDPSFTHSIGDFDYAIRAKIAGFHVFVAPGYLGTCSRNNIEGSWEDVRLPLKERLRIANSPKGIPFTEWTEYSRRYAGILWPLFGILPYLRIMATNLESRFR